MAKYDQLSRTGKATSTDHVPYLKDVLDQPSRTCKGTTKGIYTKTEAFLQGYTNNEYGQTAELSDGHSTVQVSTSNLTNEDLDKEFTWKLRYTIIEGVKYLEGYIV